MSCCSVIQVWFVAGSVLTAILGIFAIDSWVRCVLLIIYSGYVCMSPLCYVCMKQNGDKDATFLGNV